MIRLAMPAMAVDPEMKKKVLDVLSSGRYILGDETSKLESEFSIFAGTKAGAAVSSGTAALHLALLALGLKPGDEVITTTHSFIATANAIVHAGGKPVLVDIEPDTHNIDASKIEGAITPRTKGIVPVHIYGHPADMDPITEIAQKHGLFVLEDACQAHGAKYKGRPVGSLGDAAAFSFFPSKVMTVCGDGGIVATGREDVAERVRMLRNQGRAEGKKYEHDAIGFNCRISEVACAIGRLELKKVAGWIERRREIASKYGKLLEGAVNCPAEKGYAKAVYYVYTVTADDRDGLKDSLKKKAIETGIYYPVPIHMQPAYRDFGYKRMPVAEDIAGRILSLPMHPFLKEGDIRRVTDAVSDFYGS